MPKEIRLYEHGGSDQLKWEEGPVGTPGPGEMLIRQTAIGVDYIDVYVRTGLYARPLPTGLGFEAAGVITALGPRVRGFKVGERVGYSLNAPGAYAEQRLLAVGEAIKLPRGISDEHAAAVLLKGLTAWVLVRQTFKIKRGHVVLLPAAAGGVGLIVSQWAHALGARVIGVVGSPDKAAMAKRHGCKQVLVGYDNLAERVRELTQGKGVDVVYDGVGKDTFMAALDCLKPRGLMVTFGNASGAAPPLAPLELMRRGSLFLTRPTSGDYLATPGARRKAAQELFTMIKNRKIRVHIGQRFALKDAARAHEALESRRTLGSTVLLP
ncbi:MAG TPA: quinone oxidoreductase [Steroidobacteraceae bacterium]|nr:quinone oxidoreductase [Steroidobacteraceae bacterium]